jgi:MoaA/NifB/PqqE/SkfB family radical SAM enzyme
MKLPFLDLRSLFRPKFSWLQVEVTTWCNAFCRYCPQTVYRDAWQRRHLSIELFQKLVPALARTELAHLQGWGEPFLHPDLFNMIALAKGAGCRVGVTTNGMLLTQKKIDLLLESGLDLIAFSLAGLGGTNDEAREGTGFDQVLKAIQMLSEARAGVGRPRINIAYMLLRSGLGDLEGLPGALKGLGVADVVVSTLDFAAAGPLEEECLPNSGEEYAELAARLTSLAQTAQRDGLNFSWNLKPPGERGLLCPENVQQALVVSAQGRVTPCVFTNLPVSGVNYRGREGEVAYQGLDFGNLGEESLEDIWRRREYADFRRSFLTGNLALPCRHCRKL